MSCSALVPGAGIRSFQHTARYNERSNLTIGRGEIILAEDTLYKAEYLGSGTFKISKPKRAKSKQRQAALKNRRRGSRR